MDSSTTQPVTQSSIVSNILSTVQSITQEQTDDDTTSFNTTRKFPIVYRACSSSLIKAVREDQTRTIFSYILGTFLILSIAFTVLFALKFFFSNTSKRSLIHPFLIIFASIIFNLFLIIFDQDYFFYNAIAVVIILFILEFAITLMMREAIAWGVGLFILCSITLGVTYFCTSGLLLFMLYMGTTILEFIRVMLMFDMATKEYKPTSNFDV